jgi:hypothetical protein
METSSAETGTVALRDATAARSCAVGVFSGVRGRSGNVEGNSGVDERNVREGLREVSDEPLSDRVVLLGKEADVV